MRWDVDPMRCQGSQNPEHRYIAEAVSGKILNKIGWGRMSGRYVRDFLFDNSSGCTERARQVTETDRKSATKVKFKIMLK
jgi:hypothetical protein